MTPVTVCFIAQWNHDRAAFGRAFDLPFENAKLGRINQIVGGIDREEWRTDFFKVWAGIVIM